MRIEDHPETSWRPHQKRYSLMVRAVAGQAGEHRVALEGPCGSGKSLGYLRGIMDPACPPAQILSTTRAHLTQIENTLQTHYPGGDWAIIRGRSHYGCCTGQAGKKGNDRAKKQVAENISTVQDREPEDEWDEPSKGNQCPLEDDCYYRAAVVRASTAQVVVQCTIGALYRQQYWAELEDPEDTSTPQGKKAAKWNKARRDVVNREVVVLDEAHEYLNVRRSYETQETQIFLRDFNPSYVKALQDARMAGNYQRNNVLLSEEEFWPLRDHMVKEFQTQCSDQWLNSKRPTRRMTEEEWDQVKTRVRGKVKKRIDLLTGDSHEGDAKMRPVVSVQWEGRGSYEKVNLVSEPLFAAVGQKIARVEIFTSATLAPVAPLLKIEPQWVQVFPEIFDWSGKVTPNPLPDPDPDSMRNTALTDTMLEQIYGAPGRPTTIALFISRSHTTAATKRIAGKPGVFIQGKDGTLDECIKKVAEHGAGAFLVTYGGWVGTDIPGDKWLVLGSATKTPKSPFHDAREARGFGLAWNDREKTSSDKLQLAQGLGRALRSPEDKCVIIWPDNRAFQGLGLQRNARLA